VRMWAFNITEWHMTEEEYERGRSLLLPEESVRVGKFIFEKDRKSALAGRLMIRRLIHEVLKVNYKTIPLIRTKEKKPCLDFSRLPDHATSRFPFFNFNLSHQADWVILVSEPEYLLGVDVMKIEVGGRQRPVSEFFYNLRRCFTAFEWMQIYDQDRYSPHDWTRDMVEARSVFPGLPVCDHKSLSYFMRFWTLKEAYIKAVGIGLGMELQDFYFRHLNPARRLPLSRDEFDEDLGHTDAEVCVRGEWKLHWTFKQVELDEDHIVAMAYGPRQESLQTFLETFITGAASPSGDPVPSLFAPLPDSPNVFSVLSPADLFPKQHT